MYRYEIWCIYIYISIVKHITNIVVCMSYFPEANTAPGSSGQKLPALPGVPQPQESSTMGIIVISCVCVCTKYIYILQFLTGDI